MEAGYNWWRDMLGGMLDKRETARTERKGVQDGGETFPGGISHCLLMQSKWIKNWPKNWEGRKLPSFHRKREIFAHLFTTERHQQRDEGCMRHDFNWLVDTTRDLCHHFNHGTGIGPFRGDNCCAVVWRPVHTTSHQSVWYNIQRVVCKRSLELQTGWSWLRHLRFM